MFRLRKTARVDGEVVTGTDRGVVDLAMRDGVILPLPREAVVDGQEAREVAAVEGQAPAQEEVVRVSDRAKPRCNGQAAVLALKKYLNRCQVGHWPPHPGTPKYMDKMSTLALVEEYEDQILSENLRKFVE